MIIFKEQIIYTNTLGEEMAWTGNISQFRRCIMTHECLPLTLIERVSVSFLPLLYWILAPFSLKTKIFYLKEKNKLKEHILVRGK